MDKILCQKCKRYTDVAKFCMFCGKPLLDEEHFKLMNNNPAPSCLNCGRPVQKAQKKCDCGYEFKDIKCPKCLAENEYASRFCISCGEKLWHSDVFYYQYDEEIHFKRHLFQKQLPSQLYNIPIIERYKSFLRADPYDRIVGEERNMENLKSLDLKLDNNLSELWSRWKIISPGYCIKCIGIMGRNKIYCPKCGLTISADENRVKQLQNEKNYYVEPVFDIPIIKLTFKFQDHYLGSLAPSIGESQFEYRERLKWEFAENMVYKKIIKNSVEAVKKDAKRAREAQERAQRYRKQNEKFTQFTYGKYCDTSCEYYYEVFEDVGGYNEVIQFCDLNHKVEFGKYCDDYS